MSVFVDAHMHSCSVYHTPVKSAGFNFNRHLAPFPAAEAEPTPHPTQQPVARGQGHADVPHPTTSAAGRVSGTMHSVQDRAAGAVSWVQYAASRAVHEAAEVTGGVQKDAADTARQAVTGGPAQRSAEPGEGGKEERALPTKRAREEMESGDTEGVSIAKRSSVAAGHSGGGGPGVAETVLGAVGGAVAGAASGLASAVQTGVHAMAEHVQEMRAAAEEAARRDEVVVDFDDNDNDNNNNGGSGPGSLQQPLHIQGEAPPGPAAHPMMSAGGDSGEDSSHEGLVGLAVFEGDPLGPRMEVRDAWGGLCSCDTAAMLEVVQRLDEDELARVGPCVLGALTPRCLVVTTPCKDYNPVLRKALEMVVGGRGSV